MFQSLMLAKSTSIESLVTGSWSGYVCEPKYDGMRASVLKKDDRVYIYGRSFLEYQEHVPELVSLFQKVPYDFQLDGELVSISGESEVEGQLIPLVSFNQTMRIMGSLPEVAIEKQSEAGSIRYVAFDCLLRDSIDQGDLPDSERRLAAEEVISSLKTDQVLLTPRWEDWDRQVFDDLVSLDQEGVVLKNRDSIYRPNRPNKTWYKVKHHVTEDVVVMGFTPGRGKYSDTIGAIEFGQYLDDELTYRGRCSGLTDELRRSISSNPEYYLGEVMEIKINGKVGGASGGFRHPNFLRFRDDKNSKDCLWTE